MKKPRIALVLLLFILAGTAYAALSPTERTLPYEVIYPDQVVHENSPDTTAPPCDTAYDSWNNESCLQCVSYENQGLWNVTCQDMTGTIITTTPAVENACLNQGDCINKISNAQNSGLSKIACEQFSECKYDDSAGTIVPTADYTHRNGSTLECDDIVRCELDISSIDSTASDVTYSLTAGECTDNTFCYYSGSTVPITTLAQIEANTLSTLSSCEEIQFCAVNNTHYDLTTINNIVKDEDKTLSFDDKCNSIDSPADAADPTLISYGDIVSIQTTLLKSAGTVYPLDWQPTAQIVGECTPNPIDVGEIDIYLQDYPELDLNSFPRAVPIVFNSTQATLNWQPFDFNYIWAADLLGSIITNSWMILSIPETSEIRPRVVALLLMTTNTATNAITADDFPFLFEKFNVTIDDGPPKAVIKTPVSSQIAVGQPIFLEEESFDPNGNIVEWIIDFGDRSQPWGEIVDGVRNQLTTPLGCIAFNDPNVPICEDPQFQYEGPKIFGSPCICDSALNFGGKGMYEGMFNYQTKPSTQVHYYNSKEACGPDRICEIKLTVEDNDGNTDSTSVQLFLPQDPPPLLCQNVFNNSQPTPTLNATFELVGKLNSDQTSCYCKTGFRPQVDSALSGATTGNAYKCAAITIKDGNQTKNDTKKDTALNNGLTGGTGKKSTFGDRTSAARGDLRNRASGGIGKQISNDDSKDDEQSQFNRALFFAIPAIVLVALITFIALEIRHKRKKKPPTTPTTPPPTSPAQSFISKARAAGESDATIKQNLKNAGWPDSEINKYLN